MSYTLPAAAQRLTLSIALAQLQALAPGETDLTVSAVLPAGARFAGFEVGESITAFAEPTGVPWMAAVQLDGASGSYGVGAPLGQYPTPVTGLQVGHTIGGATASLRVTTVALAAAATGTADTSSPALYGPGGTLNGLTITGLASDTSPGPFAVTLVAPADINDVFQQIQTATSGDPAAGAHGLYLQILGATLGHLGTVTLGGGTALTALGLTAGTYHGLDLADLNTATAGHVTATILYTF